MKPPIKISLRHQACQYCAVPKSCLHMDWQVCADENCGIQSLDIHTETDRKVKTKGPTILSNEIFYLKTDSWRSNKEVSNSCAFLLPIVYFNLMIAEYSFNTCVIYFQSLL